MCLTDQAITEIKRLCRNSQFFLNDTWWHSATTTLYGERDIDFYLHSCHPLLNQKHTVSKLRTVTPTPRNHDVNRTVTFVNRSPSKWIPNPNGSDLCHGAKTDTPGLRGIKSRLSIANHMKERMPQFFLSSFFNQMLPHQQLI